MVAILMANIHLYGRHFTGWQWLEPNVARAALDMFTQIDGKPHMPLAMTS